MMSMDYLSFWKMRRPPFEVDSDPQFFYESRAHGEALARLLYLVSDRGMGMAALTGEIGAGKTMVLSVLSERIRKDLYSVVRLVTANLPFPHILQEINTQIMGRKHPQSETPDKYHLLKEFEEILTERIVNRGKHLLLILDEAQFLTADCLEEIKCLTNYNQDQAALSIIFAGQPELKEKLRKLPQIYQRLGMFYHLGHLEREEVPGYLEHRLRIAGIEGNGKIFDPDTTDPLYDFSHGCPRQINRVCKLAVDRACLIKKDHISEEMIRLIIRDIEKHFG
jgi:general secretion pathway protein A